MVESYSKITWQRLLEEATEGTQPDALTFHMKNESSPFISQSMHSQEEAEKTVPDNYW